MSEPIKLPDIMPDDDCADLPADRALENVSLDDLCFYVRQENACIYMPTGEIWPGANVNKIIPPINIGGGKEISAVKWLAISRVVEQMTWAPGEPMMIRDRLLIEGGWIEKFGVTIFNSYRGPTVAGGDKAAAGPWLALCAKVYPNDWQRIVRYCAHAVQRPGEKVNHGLLLIGAPGIGKDTMLAPVREAVGTWNCQEISPQEMFASQFNGYRKAILLRVSEAHDLGDVNRYQFYERMKVLCAAPPEVLRINEKNKPEYYVVNVCHVITTTNHKTDGVYLPADDRRTDACASPLKSSDFTKEYWNELWAYYDNGGYAAVAAYLADYDLSGFNPKAPPPKTDTFWEIVNSNRASEDAELADVIDAMAAKQKDAKGNDKPIPGSPVAFTLAAVLNKAIALAPTDKDGNPARNSFAVWLADRKNRRATPHRFEQCGYAPVRNPDAPTDGLWSIAGARHTIYARVALAEGHRLDAAREVYNQNGMTLLSLESQLDSPVSEVSDLDGDIPPSMPLRRQ
jgi:hypothetical protein